MPLRRLFVTLWLLLLLPACTTTPAPTSTPLPEPAQPELATAEADPTESATAVATSTPTPVPTATVSAVPTVPASPDEAWWNDQVFYEVFVRSFYDSDGDGVGDLNGLIERLDYLNDGDPNTDTDLGVTGLWLMPIMESPSYHGYDVVDYYAVDEEYGTNEDFQRLIEEAHARDMFVLVDLVLNHTSSQHPWFQEAVDDPASEYRAYYVWEDERPDYPGPYGPAWHEAGDDYYYGVFWSEMPDLNLENPAVTEELYEITRFWLEEMGADGFRLDAIKHLIEDGRLQESTPATHAWLEDYHDFYKSVNPEAMTVGEIWSGSRFVVPYVGDEVDIAFDFELSDAFLSSAIRSNSESVARTKANVIELYPPHQYATFLANHDQNRVGSRVLRDGQAKSAASMQLLFGGVPFIYYGEEIGQQGSKPDENIRRPMQWTAEGGFSVDDTAVPWNDYYEDYETRNVAAQNDDPDSLLNHYRRLVHLRLAEETLRTGSWQLVESDDSGVYAFVRQTETDTLLVVINLGRDVVDTYALSLDNLGLTAGTAEEIFADGDTAVVAPTLTDNGGFDSYTPLPLLPYSTFVIRLE